MYFMNITHCKDYMTKEIEKYQKHLNTIDFVKNIYPNSHIQITNKNTYFFDNDILTNPDLEFKVSRQRHNVLLSFYLELTHNESKINIYPHFRGSRTELQIIKQNFTYNQQYKPSYKIDLGRDAASFFQEYRKILTPVIFDKINNTIYNKVRDVVRLGKNPPTKELLQVYPELEKYVILL